MIKSMTGYGSGKGTFGDYTLSVEIKSVNNKFLETSVRMPRNCLFAEDAVKGCISSHISRGKVDVFVTMTADSMQDVTVRIHEALLDSYVDALQSIARRYGLSGELDPLSLAQLPDVLTTEHADLDPGLVTASLVTVTEQALSDFDRMRLNEGEHLCQDLLLKNGAVASYVDQIEEKAPQTAADYERRLKEKMLQTLQGQVYDESRLIQEVAIFADHVAVDEELVRLKSHIAQMDSMLRGDSPVGRKMDFLMQEFNREANTIGSKCQNSDVAHIVVDLKSEIEKMREQVQNVE